MKSFTITKSRSFLIGMLVIGCALLPLCYALAYFSYAPHFITSPGLKTEKRTQPLRIENGTWSILSLDHQDISKYSYNLQVDGDHLSGKICNSFDGNFTMNDNLLKTNQMIGTLMTCSPDIMKIEGSIMAALNSGVIVVLDGNSLFLTSASGTMLSLKYGQEPNPKQNNTLTGSVNYPERITLPPGSLLTVKVQDLPLTGAPSVTIGEYNQVTKGENTPLNFSVNYDPSLIKPGHRYSLHATITLNGKLHWLNTETYYVLGPNDQTTNIMMMLRQVPQTTP